MRGRTSSVASVVAWIPDKAVLAALHLSNWHDILRHFISAFTHRLGLRFEETKNSSRDIEYVRNVEAFQQGLDLIAFLLSYFLLD